MANNSIGAYAQGGLNDIGAYEKAPAASGTINTKTLVSNIKVIDGSPVK